MSEGRLRDPGISDGTSLLGARAADCPSLALELQTGQLSRVCPLKSCVDEYGPRCPCSQLDGPRKDQRPLSTLGILSPPPPSRAPASIGDKAGTPSHADRARRQRIV